MGRLEARYNVQLPVYLRLRDRVDNRQLRAMTSNIGLGGAFFTADFALPDGMSLQAEAPIPGNGHVLLPSRVIRRDTSGFAIKFEKLDDKSRYLLKKIINEEILAREHCPVCHNYCGDNSRQCPFCNHTLVRDADPISVSRLPPDILLDPHDQIDLAMDRFVLDMAEIEGMYSPRNLDIDKHIQKIDEAVHRFIKVCGQFEEMVQDKEIIRKTQQRFRRKTDAWAAKSHFLHHARTWPYGYVGDHKIIEDIYRHVSLSEGMGYLLDQCFLDTELGRAVPGRKDKMREIIEREIAKKSNLKILNIGCGSCRELVELTPAIIKSAAQITCLDFDSAALDFSAERFGMLGLSSHINLRKYNALRMVNKERNQKEFGSQDLIYSIGLLDYMADDSLVRFIRAMYELLALHGKFIAVFKDSTRYEVLSYHWLVDWDAFYQRNEAESKALIHRAGIAEENISVERDRTGIVIFYTIEKKG